MTAPVTPRPRDDPPEPPTEAGSVPDPTDQPYDLDRSGPFPEHRDEYPDERADDDRLLRDVPPHY